MLAVTAGGFVYIATVSIIPSVLNAESHIEAGAEDDVNDPTSSWTQLFLEVVAFCSGVAVMVCVVFLE